MDWQDELAGMGLEHAAITFRDGKDIILTICNPNWSEEKRQEFANKMMQFQVSNHKNLNIEELLAGVKSKLA